MQKNIEKALSLIKDNGSTLVMTDGETVLTSDKRGVLPLLELIDSGEYDLTAFSAADKVVGRGAALLYAYMKIKEVYALVLSEGAKEIFNLYGIPYTCEAVTPYIINRSKNGMCPIEKATENITDTREALKIIRETLDSLRADKK